MKCDILDNVFEIDVMKNRLVYPVVLEASYAIGGCGRLKANNSEEFAYLLKNKMTPTSERPIKIFGVTTYNDN